MRRLFLLALLPALLCHAASARQKSDRERAGLVGPVHTVGGDLTAFYDRPSASEAHGVAQPLVSVTYDEKGRELTRVTHGPYALKETMTYDAAGRLTESSLTDWEGELLLKETYTYDAGSRLVEKSMRNATAPGPVKETYAYDARGLLAEVAESYWGKRGNRRAFTYDEKGRLTAVETYTPKGKPGTSHVDIPHFDACPGAHKVTYGYGEGASPVEVRCYDEAGRERSKATLAYDDRGNVVEHTWSNPTGSLRRTYKYEYDARGNWTKRETRVVSIPAPDITGDTTRNHRTEVTRRIITYY